MKVILASKSPYRKRQLDELGIEFICVDSEVNEDDAKSNISDPRDLCQTLAEQKASAIASKFPEDIIIGADQLVHFNGKILGKTGNAENAVEQLMLLQGETHDLITSMCVIKGREKWQHTDVSEVTLRRLNREQLNTYVNTDQSWDCAGAYKIEGHGLALMEKVETLDHSSIVGLPMMTLITWLIELKVNLPCLFKKSL